MSTPLPIGASKCLCCGRCCRAISLDDSKTFLRTLAKRERIRLAKDPGIRHRQEIQRLIDDIAFIEKNFRRISRTEAIRRNPNFADSDFDGRFFYVCAQFGEDGTCREHKRRPFLCEGYPWYYGTPNRQVLVVTPCGYERDLETSPPWPIKEPGPGKKG